MAFRSLLERYRRRCRWSSGLVPSPPRCWVRQSAAGKTWKGFVEWFGGILCEISFLSKGEEPTRMMIPAKTQDAGERRERRGEEKWDGDFGRRAVYRPVEPVTGGFQPVRSTRMDPDWTPIRRVGRTPRYALEHAEQDLSKEFVLSLPSPYHRLPEACSMVPRPVDEVFYPNSALACSLSCPILSLSSSHCQPRIRPHHRLPQAAQP